LTGITDEDFQRLFAEPVKKKYPNVTMELVRMPQGQTVESMITSGDFPDMIYASIIDIDMYNQTDLLVDLNDLVKQNRFDLSKFEPGALDSITAYSDQNKMYALPIFMEFGGLFYNRDIFDKFGVAYPKDGMTWEQTIELGRQLTKNDGGQQYYGLDLFPMGRLSVTLRLPIADPKTERALVNTDQWKDAMELFKDVKKLPPAPNPRGLNPAFIQDKNLAMAAVYFGILPELEKAHKQGNPVNWDIAQYPSWKGQGLAEGAAVGLMITNTSKKKDAAFKVIELLTNEENQLLFSKYGYKPAHKDKKMIDSFGSDLVSIKGKNVGAIFKGKVERNPMPSKYDRLLKGLINTSANEVVKGKDINTALRELEEKGNQAIELEKKGK
jgi:multiple sugar transport system substrate-binding protein